jgi:hypothetical protein
LRTGRNEIQTNGTVAQKNSESIITATIIETWVLAATVVCLLFLLSRYNYKNFFGVSQTECSVRNHYLRSLMIRRDCEPSLLVTVLNVVDFQFHPRANVDDI